MAHFLYAALQKKGIFLNRIAFVYGNIAPDQTPAMWVAPHFGKVCPKKSGEIINSLSQLPTCSSGKIGAEYSKRLGYMCHYLCDYFCFAHNDDFNGNIKQHVAYENELDIYLRRNCLNIFDIHGNSELQSYSSADDIISANEEKKREYASVGHSLSNDLRYSFDACITSIVSLIAISQSLPAAALGIELDDFMTALKGYATGNNLIFRMFFFKYRNSNLFFMPDLMPPIGAY